MAYFKGFIESVKVFCDYAEDSLWGFDPKTQLALKSSDERPDDYFKRMQAMICPLRTLSDDADRILTDPHAPWTYIGQTDTKKAWQGFREELTKAHDCCFKVIELVDAHLRHGQEDCAKFQESFEEVVKNLEAVRGSFREARSYEPCRHYRI